MLLSRLLMIKTMPGRVDDITIVNADNDKNFFSYMRFFLKRQSFDKAKEKLALNSGTFRFRYLSEYQTFLQRFGASDIKAQIGIDKQNQKGILIQLNDEHYNFIALCERKNTMYFYPETHHVFACEIAINELLALVEILTQSRNLDKEECEVNYTYLSDELNAQLALKP